MYRLWLLEMITVIFFYFLMLYRQNVDKVKMADKY